MAHKFLYRFLFIKLDIIWWSISLKEKMTIDKITTLKASSVVYNNIEIVKG